MQLKELKDQLYEALSANRMDKAFGLMIDDIRHEGPHWDKLQRLRKTYNHLKVLIIQEAISTEDAQIESNRICGDLLELFNELRIEDMNSDGAYSAHLITNPILIITHNTEQNLDIEVFAKMMKFNRVEVRNLMSYIPDDQAYDLIVFDNMDLSACPTLDQWKKGRVENPQLMEDRMDLMQRYLDKTHYYFVHYGPPLFWCDQHHNRMMQADSRFDLFRRIHEMLRFLDALRV